MDLIAEVRRVVPYVVELRQDIHRNPEPSGQEEETAARVAKELAEIDMVPRTGIAGTGVVADLETGRAGPYILLRADMDALPLEDRSAIECRSLRPGYSHACGHDGHTAVLVGAAQVLKRFQEELAGRIRFVFQPSEERATGAQAMLDAGILADGRPDALFALHGWPGLSPNTVASCAGVIAASNDAFTIDITGRAGHSSRPDEARNPLDGMALLIQALPTLSSEHRTVTICTARAGAADNIIPEMGVLTGTTRALDERLRQQTKAEIQEQAGSLCNKLGLSAKVSFREGCTPVVNDANLFLQLQQVGKKLEPHVRVEEVEGPSMGGEDFANFMQEAPGLLIRLGMGTQSPLLHTPEFAFNDEAVFTGILVLTGMVLQFCAPEMLRR